MTELAVVLEEGFDSSPVTVRVGDTVRFSDEAVTTRPQVGYAQRFTVDVPDGEVEINVVVVGTDGPTSFTVDAGEVTHVGISIEAGKVTHRTAEEPFPYA